MSAIDPGDYQKQFLGMCFGIGLRKRGGDADPHVEFTILVEDDGNWFLAPDGGSSYWMSDLQEVLTAAIDWVKANCVEDPDGFGWDFPVSSKSLDTGPVEA
jgi:ABC-type glycerol-3-phosphate transport system substrate-binding protein